MYTVTVEQLEEIQAYVQLEDVLNLMKRLARRFFRSTDLSEAEFNLLVVLRHADTDLSQRDLSERLLVDKSNVGFGMRSWRYSMFVDDGADHGLGARHGHQRDGGQAGIRQEVLEPLGGEQEERQRLRQHHDQGHDDDKSRHPLISNYQFLHETLRVL